MSENENWIERLKKKPSDLKLLSEEEQTEELCEVAVRKNPTMFKYALKPTKELCEFAIKRKGENLKYIPLDERTLHWCQLATKQNGLALEFVPEKHKTPEILQQAVEQNGNALKFIPKEFQTETLVLTAFDQTTESFFNIKCWSEKIVLTIIKQNGRLIFDVPQRFVTDFVIKEAIKNNPASIDYIFEPTIEQALLAVSLDGLTLKYIAESEWDDFSGKAEKKNEWISREICEVAVKQNGLALEYVPFRFQDSEIIELAIKQNGLALRCIQKPFRTKTLGDLAFEQNPKSLHYHPCPSQKQLEQAVLIEPEIIFQQLPFLTMPILLKALHEKPAIWKILKNLHCHLIDEMNEREWLALARLGIEVPFFKLGKYEMNDEFIWTCFKNTPLPTGILMEGNIQINNFYYFQLFNRVWEWDEVYLQFDAKIEPYIKQKMKQTDDVKQYLADFRQQCLAMSQFRKQLKEANETSIAAFDSSVFSDFSTCFEVVQRFGLDLAFIPPEHRNYRLCRLAIHQDSTARLFSPYEI